MSLKIYHSPFSRSVRVVWACEEAGLPYELVNTPIHGRGQQPDGYDKINPLGKVPAIQDGDVTMCESLAILDYLMARHDTGLRPDTDHPDFPAYLQFYHFGESTLAMPIVQAMAHRVLLPEDKRDDAMAARAEKETLKVLNILAEPLSKHDFILPSGFSAADISCAYMLLLAKFAKIMKNAPQPVLDYFARISARDGWMVATKRD